MVNDHKFGKGGGTLFVAKGGAVWARKEGQNPKGGLNQKGRDAYNRQTGGDLKPPVSAKQAAKAPKLLVDATVFVRGCLACRVQ